MQQDTNSRYDAALKRLARVLELEVHQLAGLLGSIDTAARVARGIKGLFGNPKIDDALDDVINICVEYQEKSVDR